MYDSSQPEAIYETVTFNGNSKRPYKVKLNFVAKGQQRSYVSDILIRENSCCLLLILIALSLRDPFRKKKRNVYFVSGMSRI